MSADDLKTLHQLQDKLERLDCKRSALSPADRAQLERLEIEFEDEERNALNYRAGAGFF